jgi:hypothetical protein
MMNEQEEEERGARDGEATTRRRRNDIYLKGPPFLDALCPARFLAHAKLVNGTF